MKKISIILAVGVLIVIGLLPIIGNKFMQRYTQESVNVLLSKGLKLKDMQTNSTYLNTKKHFEFIVEDSSAFMQYINRYALSRSPLSAKKRLDGTVLGVDLAYSNLPFAKSINFDVYPIELSKRVQDELKTEDINFYNSFSAFLKKRGLLYHVKYNLINSKFKSYIKDINEEYHLQNGSDVNMKLTGVRLNGEGDILSPKALSTKIQLLYFDANQTGTKALLSLKGFHATNKFVSFSDYDSSVSLQKMQFLINGTNDDVNISVTNLKTSSNAVPKGKRVNMNSKTKLETIYLDSKPLRLDIEKLYSDVHLQGVEKELLEKMSEMVNAAGDINTISQQKEFQKLVMQILSKGFKIKIPNISLERFAINSENLGGVKIDLNLDIKEDENLSTKMQKSPLLFLSDIILNTNIKLSQKIYEQLLQNSPMAQTISAYAKKEKGSVIFKVEFKDAKLSVNGKAIQ